MDARSQAVTPPVVCCLYLEDSNGKFAFLHGLFLLYETDVGVSGPLGALHTVYRAGRPDSQLPLHLLCTLEHPNRQETHAASHCLCLLHHQDHQKQTSSKLFLFSPLHLDETSMKMETSLVKVIDDPFFVKLKSYFCPHLGWPIYSTRQSCSLLAS